MTAFADLTIAKVGGNVFAFAGGAPATALARLAVTRDAAATMSFTKDSTTVIYASATTANIGRMIVTPLQQDGRYQLYRITAALNGVSYTIDRVFSETTGSHSAIIFTHPGGDGAAHGVSGGVWGD